MKITKKNQPKNFQKTSFTEGFVDTNTGEIIERQFEITEKVKGYIDVKLPEKQKLNNGNFIVLFQKAMQEIALNHHLFTRNELAVLLYMIGTAGIGNSIYIDYPTLVEDLKIKRPHVVTAINCLVKKGIIVKNKAKGRQRDEAQLMRMSLNFDQLNYNLAYVGKFKDHSKVKLSHPPIELNQTLISPNQTTLEL